MIPRPEAAPLTLDGRLPVKRALVALGRWGRTRRGFVLLFGAVVWLVWIVSFAGGRGALDLAGNVKGADFIEFYTAGQIVASGRSAELYDFALQERIEHELTAPARWSGLHSFIYPPFYALAFVPFAAMPYLAAYALWSVLGVGCLVGGVWLVSRTHPVWRGTWRSAILWIVAFVPVFAAISYGQNSLLSLGLLAAAYAALRRGRDLAGGLILGLLLFKPQMLLVLGVLLLLDRRWRVLSGVAASAAALVGIGIAAVPEAMRAYADLAPNLPAITASRDPMWKVHSWYGFFALLLPGAAAAFLATVASLGTLLAARSLQPRWEVESLPRWFAAALWAAVLVNPHLMLYDLSLLVLAALLLWPAEKDDPLWVGGVAAIWAAIALSQPLALVLRQTSGLAFQFSVPVIAVAGWYLLQHRSSDQSVEPSWTR